MEDFFIIPEKNIDSAWNPPDKTLELFILEYCEEVLDIPLYLICDTQYTEEGIEIELAELEDWMAKEDWYVNLFRISTYVRAS